MNFRNVRHVAFGVALAVLSSHSRAATFVKGPFLHNVTKRSIHISWETDVPTSGRIDYGTNADYGSEASSPESSTHHEVLLEGLHPDTVYHYKVTAGDAVSDNASFRTAVKAGTPFKFTVYGDTQALNAHHKQVVAMSHRLSPDFYMVLGDLVSERDAEDQWQKWFDTEQIQLRKTPFFPVKGNHDGTGEVLQRYFPMMRKWFKRNNGQPAADNELYHCSFFEVDGRAVRYRDYDSESSKVYDWFRVVKDDDGKVVVRENSVVPPRAAGDAR